MADIKGTSNQVLDVDLTSGQVSSFQIIPEHRRQYLGALGLGLKLLFDRLAPGGHALDADNILAVMPGVLMGTGAPCSGRFAALAKSPLTGLMAHASCGGPFGMALKTAGWDGLLIRGKSRAPVYLDIDSTGAAIKDASHLWGLEIPQAQAELDAKRRASLVIGPAGENLCRFANIASGSRFLGRGGLGAVLGSKLVKAVVARGGAYKIRPQDPAALSAVKKRATAYINRNPITGQGYRDFGTNYNVRYCQEANILPVRNFQAGCHPEAEKVSGQAMALAHDTKHHTCKPCTILCGHSGVFGGRRGPAPEYETVGLLGTSLGIFDPELIAGFNDLCGRLGLDTISAGGTLAWVMEAAEKGLYESPLRFGSPEGVVDALTAMAGMQGDGAELGLGCRSLSEKYGGKDFAMHVKGMELAAYDPRGSFGQGLAYATANRGGCHLSAYLVAQEIYLGLLNPRSAFGKARWVKFFEDLTCCINSLQACQFTMYAYTLEAPLAKFTPKKLLAAMMQFLPALAIPLVDFSPYRQMYNAVTGLNITRSQFLRAGERIHVTERLMNLRQGLTAAGDTLPPRLLSQGREGDAQKRTVPLGPMLRSYYRLRGYGPDGAPTAATLKRLGIG